MPVRGTDRTFVLKRDSDKSDIGLIDPGLFEGKNNLHAFMEPATGLWTFKYDHGIVPPVLRTRFTSFMLAKEQAEIYFKSKKITVVEIRD